MRVAGVATIGLCTVALGLAGSRAASAIAQPAYEAPVTISNLQLPAQAPDAPATVEPTAPQSMGPQSMNSGPQALPDAENDEPRAVSLAALVADQDIEPVLDPEERCLATAIFYEARSESLAGQLAVARVIINRTRSGRFPTSVCGVVTQPGQFSFVRGGRLPDVANRGAQWRNAQAIAQIATDNGWKSQAEGALFFHAARVAPGWGRQRLTQIDNHIFYR